MQLSFFYEGPKSMYIIEDALNDSMSNVMRGVFEDYYYIDRATSLNSDGDNSINAGDMGTYYSRYTVPALVQERSYYCAPASVIQALIGSGDINQSELAQSNLQETVANDLGTDRDGTYITNVTSYMNQNCSLVTFALRYRTKAFTRYTYDSALSYVSESLRLGGCPILRIYDTADLDCYNIGGVAVSCTHYVTLSYYDVRNALVNFVDPNCNMAYNGIHSVSFDDFESCINYDGRISVLSTDTGGYYEYIY